MNAMKTVFNPDRSKFHVKFAQKPYPVLPGRNSYPEAVAVHIATKLAMWGVKLLRSKESADADEAEAKVHHAEAIRKWAISVLTRFKSDNEAAIALGSAPPDTDDVKEARRILKSAAA